MRNVSVLLFVLVSVSVYVRADVNQDLHRLLLRTEHPTNPLDLDGVKNLVEQGADVNSIGPTGGNAVNSAVEGWAYLATNGKMEKAAQVAELIRYLLERGSDPSPIDYRGLSPIYY